MIHDLSLVPALYKGGDFFKSARFKRLAVFICYNIKKSDTKMYEQKIAKTKRRKA